MGVDGRGKANTENLRNGNYKSKIFPKKEQRQRNSRKRIVLKCSPLSGNIYFHIKITIKIIVLIDDINFISLDIFNMYNRYFRSLIENEDDNKH